MEVFGYRVEFRKRYVALLVLWVTSVASLIVAYAHKEDVAEFLNRLAEYVRDSGLW
jgi:hypothetical protein